MAKLNYSESAPLASGKIGGQQIIKNRHGVILQSISQPPSFGTVEQKKQRFVTNTLAQKWKQLTASQKQSFVDSATTWFKKSKTGQLINQSPYGLFLFLQQNSALIGEDGPLFGVDYESLVEPQAYLTNKNQFSIMVKSDNTVNDYEYLVIIDPRSTGYRVAQQNNELLVGKLTALELDQGIDVAPMIQNHFDFVVNMSLVSVRVTPIEIGTGRRGEEISWLYQLPASKWISGFYNSQVFTGSAMSQDGSVFFIKRHNAFIRTFQLGVPWHPDTYTSASNYSGLTNPTDNFVFSSNGLNLYIINRNSNPAIIYHYILSTPYDVTTQTLNATYSVVSHQSGRTLYLTYDGKFLIVSNLTATYKLEMTTPFDLSTAYQNDVSTSYKAQQSTSIFFSTDGLTFFTNNTVIINQYKITTPFDIQQLPGVFVKSFDLTPYNGPPGANFASTFMTYDGSYFAVGQYRSDPNYNNFNVFKFGSPFNL